jgi:N-acetylmuramoyl-L-alanine amidase
MKTLVATLLIALLAGCATPTAVGPQYDHTYTAAGQSSRARFLVLHYTVSDRADSIKILTQQQVSAHYLVTDDPVPVIYNLVDEKNAAWHAGNSSWKNFTQLNNSSIGIEIVNPGWKDTPNGRVYAPFPQAQIDAIIPLVRDIVTRNRIAPENVLGHSDIAPLRKQDPGPMFPWRQLADAGLVVWPNAARVATVADLPAPAAGRGLVPEEAGGLGLRPGAIGRLGRADPHRAVRLPDEIPPGQHRRRRRTSRRLRCWKR